MANKIKITDEELKKYIDKYLDEVCDGNPQFIKFGELSKYLKRHGHDISDNYLRRNDFARPYIDTMKAGYEGMKGIVLATYETLDINRLFKENATEEKLRRAVQERDEYYEQVAKSAMEIHDSFTKATKELHNCKQEIKKLEDEKSEIQSKLTDANREIKKYRERVSYLKRMVNEYLYEDIAKKILDKPLLVNPEGYVTKDMLDKSIIDDATEIKPDDSIENLFFNFGDDNETV